MCLTWLPRRPKFTEAVVPRLVDVCNESVAHGWTKSSKRQLGQGLRSAPPWLRKTPEPNPDAPKRTAGKAASATPPDDDWSRLSQREKFIRTAREVGADETGEALDAALRAIGRARKPPGSA